MEILVWEPRIALAIDLEKYFEIKPRRTVSSSFYLGGTATLYAITPLAGITLSLIEEERWAGEDLDGCRRLFSVKTPSGVFIMGVKNVEDGNFFHSFVWNESSYQERIHALCEDDVLGMLSLGSAWLDSDSLAVRRLQERGVIHVEKYGWRDKHLFALVSP